MTASETPFIDDREAGATFSEDREYRYRLWRKWNGGEGAVAFIMLNPSTADESDLDATCTRCKGYAERWGYGALIVGNIFALKSTDPDGLYEHPNPVGEENNDHLLEICDDADLIVAAWGNHGELKDRGREVADLITSEGHDLFALNITQKGQPTHPLYQPKDAELEAFDGGMIND